MTQAYVGLALGRGLGAGPCLIWLVDGPIGIEEPLAVTGLTRPSGRRTRVKQRMASDSGPARAFGTMTTLSGSAPLKYGSRNSLRRPFGGL